MNNKSILNEALRKADNDIKYYNELMDNLFGETFQKSMPHFDVVSFEQFKKDWMNTFDDYNDTYEDIEEIKDIYNGIKLPSRGTAYSAGYDFFSPIHFCLKPGESIMIPTGIRAYMPNNMVLKIYPRSGLGSKYQLCLANTVAVVDADYINADNEGDILLKLVNRGDKMVTIEKDKGIVQGVFSKYYTTHDDQADTMRIGGFGSTDNKKK